MYTSRERLLSLVRLFRFERVVCTYIRTRSTRSIIYRMTRVVHDIVFRLRINMHVPISFSSAVSYIAVREQIRYLQLRTDEILHSFGTHIFCIYRCKRSRSRQKSFKLKINIYAHVRTRQVTEINQHVEDLWTLAWRLCFWRKE